MKWVLLLVVLSLSCAHTKLERWDPAGEKILEVSTLNWFSGDVFAILTFLDVKYHTGAERKGLSSNGLSAIQEIPEIATSIGKAATGTSAIEVPEINIDRSTVVEGVPEEGDW